MPIPKLEKPEIFTAEQYKAWKADGLTDAYIREEILFVGKEVMTRWKKELGKVTQPKLEKPEMFTAEQYKAWKADGLTDVYIRKEILFVGKDVLTRWKKEVGIELLKNGNMQGFKKAIQPKLEKPEIFTAEQYKKWKADGLTDAYIREEILFVGTEVLNRWKKEVGIQISGGKMLGFRKANRPIIKREDVLRLLSKGMTKKAIAMRYRCTERHIRNIANNYGKGMKSNEQTI